MAVADLTSQLRSSALDGGPMFARAYMGRKRILPMLSLHAQRFFILAAVFSTYQKRWKGLRPVFFSPCTRGRTWGTRPGMRAWFFAPTTASPMKSTWAGTPARFSDPQGAGLSLIPAAQLERYRHTCFAQFIAVGSVLQGSSDHHAAYA